jgi:benzoyl-CoA-dihydrodiol lyase
MNAPDAASLTHVNFRTEPSRYRHWRLTFDGPVAMLAIDVAEDGGLRPGYTLKLNSYDLGGRRSIGTGFEVS